MLTAAVRYFGASLILIGVACLPGPVPNPGPDAGPASPAPSPTTTAPPAATTPTPEPRSGMPAVPNVVGPIALRVVYPPSGSQIATRDSNFIFGSVGSGTATLRINGRPVEVKPNGSFLAYLPVPVTTQGAAVYEIEVAQASDTVRTQHRVTLPAEPVSIPSSGPWIVDSSSLSPRTRPVLERWEAVRVSIRVGNGAQAELQLPDGARVPMVAASPNPRGAVVATEVAAVRLNSGAWVQVFRGRDSVR